MFQVVVIFANLGGVFNFGAYTFVRKRTQEESRGAQTSTSGSATAVSTVSQN